MLSAFSSQFPRHLNMPAGNCRSSTSASLTTGRYLSSAHKHHIGAAAEFVNAIVPAFRASGQIIIRHSPRRAISPASSVDEFRDRAMHQISGVTSVGARFAVLSSPRFGADAWKPTRPAASKKCLSNGKRYRQNAAGLT